MRERRRAVLTGKLVLSLTWCQSPPSCKPAKILPSKKRYSLPAPGSIQRPCPIKKASGCEEEILIPMGSTKLELLQLRLVTTTKSLLGTPFTSMLVMAPLPGTLKHIRVPAGSAAAPLYTNSWAATPLPPAAVAENHRRFLTLGAASSS